MGLPSFVAALRQALTSKAASYRLEISFKYHLSMKSQGAL